MSRLLFSGTLVSTGVWEQVYAGPAAGQTVVINSLYLINGTGSSATVQLRKLVDGFGIELYNDTIPDGVGVEITDTRLDEGQALEIQADQLISYSAYGTTIGAFLRPEYDVEFDCLDDFYRGIIEITTEVFGHPTSVWFDAEEVPIELDLEVFGDPDVPTVFVCPESGVFDLELVLTGDAVISFEDARWVGWSKIGEASFKADLVNDAGFMPMDWDGVVYVIKQLGKNAVIYGNNGIAMLFPVKEPAPTFGKQTISLVGVMCKSAVAGDEHEHFYIDVEGVLWRLSGESPERLGYEQYFSELNNPILTYDKIKRYIYISDQENGYLLTLAGLGGGYAGITGFFRVNGQSKLVSPEPVETPVLNVMTDIIDLGYRGLKTIESVQYGISLDARAEAAIDFRYMADDAWRTTQWVRLSPEGVAFIRTAGLEFRFRLRMLEPGFCEVSYMNIQYKKTDYRYVRSSMGVNHGNNPPPT